MRRHEPSVHGARARAKVADAGTAAPPAVQLPAQALNVLPQFGELLMLDGLLRQRRRGGAQGRRRVPLLGEGGGKSRAAGGPQAGNSSDGRGQETSGSGGARGGGELPPWQQRPSKLPCRGRQLLASRPRYMDWANGT